MFSLFILMLIILWCMYVSLRHISSNWLWLQRLPSVKTFQSPLEAKSRESMYPAETSSSIYVSSSFPKLPHLAQISPTFFLLVAIAVTHAFAATLSLINSVCVTKATTSTSFTIFAPCVIGLDVVTICCIIWHKKTAFFWLLELALFVWPVGVAFIDQDNMATHLSGYLCWTTAASILLTTNIAVRCWKVHLVEFIRMAVLLIYLLWYHGWSLETDSTQFVTESLIMLEVFVPTCIIIFTIYQLVDTVGQGGSIMSQLQQSSSQLQERLQGLEADNVVLKEKANCVSRLAHEVRTPLNALLSCCTLLEDSQLTPEQQEYVRLMLSCGGQINDNVNYVLECARLEEKKVALESKPFHVRDVCLGCLDMVKHLAEKKGLELKLECLSNLPTLLGDGNRLRQALMNLLTNSIKFTGKGSVTLAATVLPAVPRSPDLETLTTKQAPGRYNLHFEVLDTGIGLSAADEARLFQSFGQASSSTWGTFGGSGLGLVISKELIGLMGGSIGIDHSRTAVGQGSCFVVDLILPEAIEEKGLLSTNVDAAYSLRTTIDGSSVEYLTRVPQVINSNVVFPRGFSSRVSPCASSLMNYAPSSPSFSSGLASEAPTAAAVYNGRNFIMTSETSATVVSSSSTSFDVEETKASYLSSLCAGDRKLTTTCDILSPLSGETTARADRTKATSAFAAFTVMVVDDNSINLQLMGKILDTLGFVSVLTAAGPEEAMDKFKRNPQLHLLLTDMHMPGMNGHQLSRWMRAHKEQIHEDPRRYPAPSLRWPVIVLLSGDVDMASETHGEDIDAFISKPVSRAQLQQVATRWLLEREASLPMPGEVLRRPSFSSQSTASCFPSARQLTADLTMTSRSISFFNPCSLQRRASSPGPQREACVSGTVKRVPSPICASMETTASTTTTKTTTAAMSEGNSELPVPVTETFHSIDVAAFA